MADEEKKDQQEERPKKKGFLSALIFVAVGAALGGAAVVMLTPPPKQLKQDGKLAPQLELVEHEDVMKFVVNPETDRGRVVARIGFRFVYKMDKNHEQKVLEAIETYWNRAFSRCIVVISSQKASFLMTAEGKQSLRKMLVAELTLSLFPNGEALVDDILWTEYILQ